MDFSLLEQSGYIVKYFDKYSVSGYNIIKDLCIANPK